MTTYFIPFTAHSLFYQTIMCILGIALQAWLFTPIIFIASAIATILAAISFILFRKKIFWSTGILIFIFTCGSLRFYQQQKNHTDFYSSVGNHTFSTTAVVTNISPLQNSRMKWRIELQTLSIQLLDDHATKLDINKTLHLYTLQKPAATVQDTIEVKNLILKKTNKDSYDQYLIKEDIAATLFLTTFNYTVINHPTYSLQRWIFYFKEHLLQQCRKKLSAPTFAFFSSVFLGNREWGKKQMEKPKEYCKTWGISHYLARSGLHMVIFIYAWHMLINLLPISLLYKEIFLIFLSILYYVLSWSSISFIRAFLSFMLYKSCNLLKVQSQLLHLLTIVTLAVLFVNPMQLFFLDFQLSFGLTFALAWFNHVHNKKL